MRLLNLFALLTLLSCKKESKTVIDIAENPPAESKTNITGSIQTKDQSGYSFVDTTIKFEIKLKGTENYTLSSASRNFQFRNIKRGEYRIEVEKVGYGTYRSEPILTNDAEWQPSQNITVYRKPTFELKSFKMKDSVLGNNFLCITLSSTFNDSKGTRIGIVLFGKNRNITLNDTSSFFTYNSVRSDPNTISGQTNVYWRTNLPNTNGLNSGTYLYAISVSYSGLYWRSNFNKPTDIVSGSVILKDSLLIP